MAAAATVSGETAVQDEILSWEQGRGGSHSRRGPQTQDAPGLKSGVTFGTPQNCRNAMRFKYQPTFGSSQTEVISASHAERKFDLKTHLCQISSVFKFHLCILACERSMQTARNDSRLLEFFSIKATAFSSRTMHLVQLFITSHFTSLRKSDEASENHFLLSTRFSQ